MPFTSQEIQDAGKIGLDFYLKNKPVDQIAVERPHLKALNEGKSSFPGGKQYVVEQLRFRYQSNFQWFNGSQVVTYNRRQSVEQAQYPWRSAHDGFALDEDRLVQNGIEVDDNGPGGNASGAEMLQLTNLFKEQSEILRLGFQEKFSHATMLSGTQSPDAITGRDALISTTPTTGTVGGIDRSLAQNIVWQNYAQTGLTVTTPATGNILDYMEIAWRACVRNGGRPDHIEAGDDFIDGFRNFMLKSYGQINYHGVEIFKQVKAGTDTYAFHGVEIIWNPEFDDLDATYSVSPTFSKRCYFQNMNHFKLRPITGQDMITRKPPRAYDKYEFYWGLTWRGAITMNRSNAHAVLAIA